MRVFRNLTVIGRLLFTYVIQEWSPSIRKFFSLLHTLTFKYRWLWEKVYTDPNGLINHMYMY